MKYLCIVCVFSSLMLRSDPRVFQNMSQLYPVDFSTVLVFSHSSLQYFHCKKSTSCKCFAWWMICKTMHLVWYFYDVLYNQCSVKFLLMETISLSVQFNFLYCLYFFLFFVFFPFLYVLPVHIIDDSRTWCWMDVLKEACPYLWLQQYKWLK